MADLIALLHVMFVVFVIGGFVLMLVGRLLKLEWSGNRTFIAWHLSAVVYTLIRTWVGQPCPLTVLENRVRHSAHVNALAQSAHRLVFKDADHRTFALATTVFAILVIGHYLLTARMR